MNDQERRARASSRGVEQRRRAKASSRIVCWAILASLCAGKAAAQSQAPRPAIDSTWLRADAAAKTAQVSVIAGLTNYFGGLNWNGFREGGLTLTVPVGWKVVLNFANQDPNLPHSVEVIADVRPLPTTPVSPAFAGAAGTKLVEGHPKGATEAVTFTAGRVGNYLIYCAVPGHGMAGMWLKLSVVEGATAPTLK
jgi:plastocyanin